MQHEKSADLKMRQIEIEKKLRTFFIKMRLRLCISLYSSENFCKNKSKKYKSKKDKETATLVVQLSGQDNTAKQSYSNRKENQTASSFSLLTRSVMPYCLHPVVS